MSRLPCVLAVLGACVPVAESGGPAFELDGEAGNPLAVGSTMWLDVRYKECLFGWPCGTAPPENVLEHSVAPASSYTVTQQGARFNIAAIAEGSGNVYVKVISEGEERQLVHSLVARTIDRVTVQTACASPALMQTGISTAFQYQVWHGTERLNGRIMPLTVENAELTPPDENGFPWLRLPTTPTAVTVTSPYDAAFRHEIETVDRNSIDSIVITGTSPVAVGSLSDFRAELRVGERAICGGSMPITSTITTPSTCALDPGYGMYSDTIRINAIAAGDCTLQVTLTGTSLSATRTFTIGA